MATEQDILSVQELEDLELLDPSKAAQFTAYVSELKAFMSNILIPAKAILIDRGEVVEV